MNKSSGYNSRLNSFFLRRKRLLILPLDMTLAALSYYLASAFRFDSLIPADWGHMFPGTFEFLKILGLLVLTKSVVLVLFGLYRSIWAYASTHDLFLIFRASLLSSLVVFVVLMLYNRLSGISRSVLILDGVLLFLFLCFRSFSWRLFRDLVFQRASRDGRKTLLIGAGLAANRLAAELRVNSAYRLIPIGFLDDDPAKLGATIQGLPVLGPVNSLEKVLESYAIEEIIITTKLEGNRVRFIYRACEGRHISCKTLPPLRDILSRPELGKSLREISLEDLLGRNVVRLETEGIRQTLGGKTILVTGAGGSIGSEVCRQLLNFQPGIIILIDNAETPLYEIDYELRNKLIPEERKIRFISLIADIRDKKVMERIFKEHDVHAVFHCAAYKHVPMMELNPSEAVRNNVLGTVTLANAARNSGIDRFVMISTDKAVNPTNIMGATKRIAELYIQNLSRGADTKFITVRFGNVLGSNGSVIPLFRKQIAEGGPVTVTHPDIIRYFMTIQEAAGLVIQAGVIGRGSEIFILDMGEPVKIKTLAEDIIRFSGLVPYEDIEIRYIGLRPGEKLFEELLLDDEGIQPTRHDKIYIAQSRDLNLNTLSRQIELLGRAAEIGGRGDVDSAISDILSAEYRPVFTYGTERPASPSRSVEEISDAQEMEADAPYTPREIQGERID